MNKAATGIEAITDLDNDQLLAAFREAEERVVKFSSRSRNPLDSDPAAGAMQALPPDEIAQRRHELQKLRNGIRAEIRRRKIERK